MKFYLAAVASVITVLLWARHGQVSGHQQDYDRRVVSSIGASSSDKSKGDDSEAIGTTGAKGEALRGSPKVTARQIKEVTGRLRRWLKVQTQLDGQSESAEVLSQLARDPSMVSTFKASLLDIDWALQVFGEDQAEVRVLAIAVLGEEARQGDAGPVREAISGLLEQFAQTPQEKTRKGRAYDLVDLLTTWIQVFGKERFIQDPGMLLSEFDFSDVHRAELARAAQQIYPGHSRDTRFLAAFNEAWKR